jgi:hypothetical protein
MLCLGTPQATPNHEDASVAQLRAVELFRQHFLSRYPAGIVLTELEYMGHTTRAPQSPGPLQFRGRPAVNAVLEALTRDFRNWVKNSDYRKCDALGIDGSGTYGELLEITTESNANSAIGQVGAKLTILRSTVNRVNNLHVDWQATRWRPTQTQCFYPLRPNSAGEVRYVCYQPTVRSAAPAGVVLYEIHVVVRPRVPVPVPIPKESSDQLRQSYRTRQRSEPEEAWARRFIIEHPSTAVALRALAALGGLVLAVSAVVLIFDPLPGDEAAAGAAALALLRFATA